MSAGAPPALRARYLPIAEHGLIGLTLFVALMVCVLFDLWHLVRNTRGDPGREWIGSYAAGVAIAVIGFAAGGAFVNMPYFDMYIELVAMTVVLRELALRGDRTAGTALDDRRIELVRRDTVAARS